MGSAFFGGFAEGVFTRWTPSDKELDNIYNNFPAEVAQGVEWNIMRYNEGATGHVLNGIGKDATATARYLAQQRTFTYQDSATNNPVFYDSVNRILLIQSPGGGLHGYNFTSSQWGNAVDAGEFMPLEPGVVAPAVAP